MRAAMIIVVLATFLTGCPEPPEPESQLYLQRITPIPISMTSRVQYPPADVEDIPTIFLSDGAAMGLGCSEYCAQGLGPRQSCEGTTATFRESGIAEVRDAFLLSGAKGARVLIAKAPGTTILTVTSPCVSADFRVVIEPFEP